MKTIWFDMDGTIADLYGVKDWLNDLIAEKTTPYEKAPLLYDKETLKTVLKKLTCKGYKCGVVSWCSKNSTTKYDIEVAKAKKEWLKEKELFNYFEKIEILPYGTCKRKVKVSANDVLIDDEERNLKEWGGNTIDAKQNIIKVLTELL